jgi:hypothetical protein
MEGKETTRRTRTEKKLQNNLRIALYEKLKRATIPLMDETDYKVLYSSCIFELQADHENIILHKYFFLL